MRSIPTSFTSNWQSWINFSHLLVIRVVVRFILIEDKQWIDFWILLQLWNSFNPLVQIQISIFNFQNQNFRKDAFIYEITRIFYNFLLITLCTDKSMWIKSRGGSFYRTPLFVKSLWLITLKTFFFNCASLSGSLDKWKMAVTQREPGLNWRCSSNCEGFASNFESDR